MSHDKRTAVEEDGDNRCEAKRDDEDDDNEDAGALETPWRSRLICARGVDEAERRDFEEDDDEVEDDEVEDDVIEDDEVEDDDAEDGTDRSERPRRTFCGVGTLHLSTARLFVACDFLRRGGLADVAFGFCLLFTAFAIF